MLLGLLGGGVLVAAVSLWESVDIRQLTPGLEIGYAAPPPPDLPSHLAVAGEARRVAIFRSYRNQGFFPDTTYYRQEVGRWVDIVASTGAVTRALVDEAGLASLELDEVLVVPEAPCLSDAERGAIMAHYRGGGDLVANWAIGVRNADCEWLGWEMILELTGAEEVQDLGQRRSTFVTIPGGIPLSPGIDPGTRVELRPDPSLALRMPGARVYWSDWALNPAPDDGGLGTDVAAVATRSAAGGRVTWFGFRAGQHVTQRDSVYVRRLLQNGVRWAAGEMSASPAPWPGGAQAAMLFALDVEDEPEHSTRVAALFQEQRLPGTFFVVSQLVERYAELGAALAAAGEVGSQTVDHMPLGGLSAQDQLSRLRRSWDDVEAWSGRGPAGLRPPEEAFDSATIRAWAAVGGEYILARNEGRSASPEVHHVDRRVVVVLPKLLKDDYNVVVQDRALRASRIGIAFVTGAKKIHAIGGLAVVSGHTQIMMSDSRREAYRTVADSARGSGDWWFANGRDIARWWRARAQTSVSFVDAEPLPVEAGVVASGRPDILVTAPLNEGLQDFWVDVVLPDPEPALTPLVDGRSLGYVATHWGMRVPVGTLGAGQESRISFVLSQDDADAPRPGT